MNNCYYRKPVLQRIVNCHEKPVLDLGARVVGHPLELLQAKIPSTPLKMKVRFYSRIFLSSFLLFFISLLINYQKKNIF